MKKPVLVGSIITTSTIICLLFVGEYWVRNFVLVSKATGDCGLSDDVLRFKGKPNSQCSSRTPEWNIKFKLNSFGLHGPETTLEKPPNTYRILFLGDSFAQGYGVEEDKSFPRLVEKRLNEISQDKRKIEVINAGIPNHSPLLEYLYLKNEGIRFNPDLVILEFDLTDFSNDLAYSREAVYDPHGIPTALPPPEKVKPSSPSAQKRENEKPASVDLSMEKNQLLPFVPRDIKKFFHDHSVLYKWISTNLKILQGAPLADPPTPGVGNFYTIVKEDTSFDDKLWEQPKKNLHFINEFLKERKVPFIVSAHPQGILVNEKEWPNGRLLHGLERNKVYSARYFEELAKFTKSEDIGFIDLLNDFRESKQSPLFFPFDGHFTETGHKVAADGIVKELVRKL